MEWRYTPKQAKRTEHPYQSEAMVSMQVRNKDGIKLREIDMGSIQLHLRPFPAINHKKFSSDFYNLRRGIVSGIGSGATAS